MLNPFKSLGDTKLSEDWLTKNAPAPIEFGDDAVLSAKIKSDDAYTELGEYNRYIANNDNDIAIRGVDDMYDAQNKVFVLSMILVLLVLVLMLHRLLITTAQGMVEFVT